MDSRFLFVLNNDDDDDVVDNVVGDIVDERFRCSSRNLKLVDDILAWVVDTIRPRKAIPPRRGK